MADYGVNINLRVKGQSGLDRLKTKVNELTASIDKIRGVDIMNPRNIGGAAGKGARKTIKQYRQDMDSLVKSVRDARGAFGKTANQQMAAADALQEYANSLTLGTKAQRAAASAARKQIKNIDLETTAIMENTKARKNNRALVRRIGGFGGRQSARGGRGGDGALQSALVSGAFPLLFGQGLLGGAFGFAGGFAGTKMGGQMGGFAGGLVATAVLQQLTTLANSMNELGNAFNEIEPNVDKLTVSLGLAGTMEEKRLKIIAKSEGAHVALAMATEKMNQTIGEKGVQNLKEFAESSRILGNSFTLAMTKMQAALAPFFSALAKIGGGITGASQKERARLLELGEAEGGSDVARLNILREQLAGMSGKKQEEAKRRRVLSEIADIEERLIKEGKSVDLAKTRQAIFDDATKSLESQNTFLQNQILLGERGAEIERLKLETAKKMGIAVEDLTDDQVKQLENLIKTRDELKLLNDLYQGIASTVQSGLVDAIEGAINGTKTLGDVARSVFGAIQRQLINFAATSFLRAIPGIGGFFADGGRPPVGKPSIVGERGAELFVPDRPGTIIPNPELGGMGGSTNIVVNVDASGSSVEGDEEEGRALGVALSAAIETELIKQKRPGGLLA